MTFIKRMWSDPVGSAVIAGIILAAPVILTYMFNLWEPIRAWLLSVWEFSFSNTELVNWFIGVMLICTVLIGLRLLILIRNVFFRKENGVDAWKQKYTSDIFLGIRWRWRFNKSDSVYDLKPFCPDCDYELQPNFYGAYISAQEVYYPCDPCNKRFGPYGDNTFEVESKIERFIQQKVRADTWSK